MEYTLTEIAEALDMLDRVESYLYATTYESIRHKGYGPPYTWNHWFELVNSSVNLVRGGQNVARSSIALRIGATLGY